jgi:hypothetical protein
VVAIPSLGDVVAATVRGGHVLAATSDGGVSFMSFVYSNGNYVANTPKAIHVPH